LKLYLTTIQLCYDVVLFEKPLDFPQLSLRAQARVEFLKRAVTKKISAHEPINDAGDTYRQNCAIWSSICGDRISSE
jgi:hypothetical protein